MKTLFMPPEDATIYPAQLLYLADGEIMSQRRNDLRISFELL